jgi:hypothetical protein
MFRPGDRGFRWVVLRSREVSGFRIELGSRPIPLVGWRPDEPFRRPDALPALRFPHDRAPAQDHGARLPDLPLRRVSAHLQRADQHACFEYPTDVVLLIVLRHLRSKLSMT